VGPAALRQAWPETAAEAATLTLADVDAAIEAIARTAGPRSTAERVRRLRALLEVAMGGIPP
jgi:acyl-CoA reductase-like NAD-dependent aldehyde dehydrogenase